MLGYVKIYKPELKVKEYEVYRGLYCSLCRRLGKDYGIFSRLLLSYDTTFLALVLLAVCNISPDFKQGRCPFNCAKRCNYCLNADEQLSFSAAVTVLLFYYKVKDNIKDGGFFKRAAMYLILPFASLKRRKALKKYSDIDAIISESMNRQNEVEKTNTESFDIAAHNSADALGKIFSHGDGSGDLYRFGYFIGRWVYLIDAADDIKKDAKSGSFNVFVNKFKVNDRSQLTKQQLGEIKGTLNISCGEAAKAYSKLKVDILFSIIDNVIFESMSVTMDNMLKGTRSDSLKKGKRYAKNQKL